VVRQTRIAIRLVSVTFFDLQFPHSKFLNPFFFSLWSFSNLVRQVQKAPFSFLAASFPNLRCCRRPSDFLGQEKNRSPTITRKYRNPFLQLVGAHSNPRGKRIINSATIIRVYGNSSREYLSKWGPAQHNTDLWRAIVAEGKDDHLLRSWVLSGSHYTLVGLWPLKNDQKKLPQQRVCESHGSG
jgi:hypothetical protein